MKLSIGLLLLVAAAWVLAACVPRVQAPGPAALEPVAAELADARLRLPDGMQLPVTTWAADEPRAVLIAVHGMNGYAEDFALPAAWFAREAAITTYAYDQRGFGRAPQRGLWAGDQRMVDDLAQMVGQVRARHAGLPVFVLGGSMGGAVVMSAAADQPLGVDGLILVAPAVWGWSAQPFQNRAALWVMAHLLPWTTFSGGGLDIMPTDNIEVLRAMSRDPLLIRETRVDAIYGLVELMERAAGAADQVRGPVLLLYGEKDEIIPRGPVEAAARRLCAGADTQVAIYADGWHMLLRDLQADTVRGDIAAWMMAPGEPLPSQSVEPPLSDPGAHLCAPD